MESVPDNVAPDIIAQQRFALCNACEHKTGDMCSKCGCILPAKTRTANAECPLHKWGKYEPQNI